jgi:hypothetical protein
MFIDLIPMAINAAFMAALALLILAWRWEEQRDEFLRLGGWIGLGAAVAGLATSLIMVLDPAIMSLSPAYVILLLMTLVVPLLAVTGAVLVLLRRGRGVQIFVVASALWLFNVALGFIGSVFYKG